MCQERKGPGHESDLEPAEELLSLLLLLLPAPLPFCSHGDCAFARLPTPLDPPNYRGAREEDRAAGGQRPVAFIGIRNGSPLVIGTIDNPGAKHACPLRYGMTFA